MISSEPTGKFVVHRRSQSTAMGILDGFFLMRIFGETTPGDIYATLECHQLIVAERPRGAVSVVAIDSTNSLPSEATRRASVEVTKKTRLQTLGVVIIVLGDGFWASAFRGVMTAVNLLNQATYPRTVVRYEEEGVDWAIETSGERNPRYRSALLAALAELRPIVVAHGPSMTVPTSMLSTPRS